VLGGVRARITLGRRDAGGRSGASLCLRPHEDVALHEGDALDLHQLLAELNERLRIERELPAEGAQGYAPMALEKRACAVNCLEEAHVRLTIVGRDMHVGVQPFKPARQPARSRTASSAPLSRTAAYLSRSARKDLAWYFCAFCVHARPSNSTLNSSWPAATAAALANAQGMKSRPT